MKSSVFIFQVRNSFDQNILCTKTIKIKNKFVEESMSGKLNYTKYST